jgi:hypothetical protein
VVHERFKADALVALKVKHPEACVLVHPESPQAVVELADVVGSTTALINAVKEKILQSGNPRLTSKWHFHPIPILSFLARGFLPFHP